MMEDELIRIWQSSPIQERVKFEKSRLLIDVQSSLDRIHKSIKYRDLREIIAAIIVIPIFIYYAFIIPFVLSKIASVWIALWAIFVIFRLRRAKKNKPSVFTENYVTYLYKTREYLTIQKRLLDSVLYWYYFPCAIGIVMFFVGSIGDMEVLIYNILGVIGLGILVYYLNKRTVKKEIRPRLEKINELIYVMEEL